MSEEPATTQWITVHVNNTLSKRQVLLSSDVSELLQDVCTEFKLKPALYILKHSRLGVISGNIGALKLQTNAQLKLVPTPHLKKVAMIRVAIAVDGLTELTPQQRLEGSFPSSSSLYEILKKFAFAHKVNLVNRVHETTNMYRMPIVSILRKEYGDLVVLYRTTLKAAGITSGSVLMRLRFKDTNMTLTEKKAISAEFDVAAKDKEAKTKQLQSQKQQHIVEKAAVQVEIKRKISTLNHFLSQLEVSARDRYGVVTSTLVRIHDNLLRITREEDETRVRQLNLDKRQVADLLGNYAPAMDILNLLGWREDLGNARLLVMLAENEDHMLLRAALPVLQEASAAQPFVHVDVGDDGDVTMTDPHVSGDDDEDATPFSFEATTMENREAFSFEKEEKIVANTNDEEEVKTDPDGDIRMGDVTDVKQPWSPPSKSMFDDMNQDNTDDDSETARKAILEAPYNISDVRSSLKLAREHVMEMDLVLKLLKLLHRISNKLLTSQDSKFRTLDPSKNAFQSIVNNPGAMNYLSFVGFVEMDTEKGKRLVLDPTTENSTKISRAVSILGNVILECTPKEEEMLAIELGPVDPCVTVIDMSLEKPLMMDTKEESQVEQETDDEAAARRADQRIYMAEMRSIQRSLTQQDMIITRTQKAKMRKERKMKHILAVLRLQFQCKNMLQVNFSPYAKLSSVFDLIEEQLSIKLPFTLLLAPATVFTKADHGDKTLDELSLAPAGLLRFRLVEAQTNGSHFPTAISVLKPELYAQRISPSAATEAKNTAIEQRNHEQAQEEAKQTPVKKAPVVLTPEQEEAKFQAYLAAKKKKALLKKKKATTSAMKK